MGLASPSDKETEHKAQAIETENAGPPVSPASDSKHDKRNGNYSFLLRKIGLEMIPVIVGILIALFINNLQQNSRDRRLLESTLVSLTEEFAENRKNIEYYLPRQQRFLDSLRYFMEDRTYRIFDIATKTNGMGTPQMHSTNWQSSLNNNSLRLLNFKAIGLLSQIDVKYRELKDQEISIHPITYGPPMFRKGEDGWEYRKALELWMISYMGNERQLLALYQQFEGVVRNKQYRRGRY